jgi:hypothetical protein
MNFRPGRMFGVALGLGVILGLTGCTTFKELHPRFKEQSAGMRGLAVSTDVLILEDVKGPVPLVNIPRLTALAESINRHFRTELEQRGYTVASTEHATIGLRYGTAVTPQIKIRTLGQAPDAPLESLSTGAAPYFVSSAYAEMERQGNLQNAFEDMWRYQPKPGAPNPVSRHVRALGPVDGATHRMLILIEGVEVPLTKGLGQALTTGLLTLGTVTAFEMTTVKFRVGIADMASGEFILIADCGLTGGWKVDEAYLQRQAGLFFQRLDHIRK